MTPDFRISRDDGAIGGTKRDDRPIVELPTVRRLRQLKSFLSLMEVLAERSDRVDDDVDAVGFADRPDGDVIIASKLSLLLLLLLSQIDVAAVVVVAASLKIL
jgi:hypothetical protein